MVVATFRVGTPWAGHAIEYQDGVFWITRGAQLTAAQVFEYGQAGQIEWAYEGMREWVYETAGVQTPSAAAPPQPTFVAGMPPTPGPPGSSPKKPKGMKVALLVGGGVLALFLLLVIVAVAVAPSQETPVPSQTPVAEVTVTTTATATATVSASPTAKSPKPNPTPTQTEPPPPTPKWVTLIKLSGNTNKRSRLFRLTGGPAKLVYTLRGSMVVMYIYVVPNGESLEQQGGFPEATPGKQGKGSTRLANDPGMYYLDISSANCSWTVKVQEKR